MNRHIRYLAIFVLPILLVFPVGIGNYLFLAHTGELDSVDKVVEIQAASGAIYGSAVHPNTYLYKLALLKKFRPQIVAIGSSRVLQFRQAHFSRSFQNLGMTANFPLEVERVVDDMLRIHRPEMVLLGIDFWWGNPRWEHAFTFAHHKLAGGELTPEALIAPTHWLLDKRITSAFFANRIFRSDPVKSSGVPMLGVQAAVTGNGFGPDGSRYYVDTLYGRRPPEDPEFSDTKRRIMTDSAQFRYGDRVDPERLESLKRVFARLKQEGIQVISMLPPIAPSVGRMLVEQGDRFGYVSSFRASLHAINSHHFDFYDALALGSDDCEFVDGFHGGDVVAARMLGAVAKHSSILPAYLNKSAIDHAVFGYTGMASADNTFLRPGEHELDFLGIGCKKQPRPQETPG